MLFHSEVSCLSRGKENVVWFNKQEDNKGHLIKDLFWIARLAYLVGIFGMHNKFNATLPRKRINKIEAAFRITPCKQKLKFEKEKQNQQ